MEREYVITLVNEEPTKKKPTVAGDNENKKKPSNDKEKKATFKGLGAMTAYSYGKSFIAQTVNHEVNMVELRTGSKEYAQKVQFVADVAQRTYAAGEMVISGAAAGGGVGAIAGLVVAGIKEVITLGQRSETLNTQRALENETLYRGVKRAGTNQSR